jgi:hypothetical protein
MSSETSTKKVPAKAGSHAATSKLEEDQGFQTTHFFTLLSLLAATVAVIMARPSAPENLILTSLTIGAAGLAAWCFYRVLAPLVAPHVDVERQPLSDRMRLELEREKALTLRSIKELEFDKAMGKVSPQDFDEMSARLRARALGLMQQLDAGSTPYRDVIEKELAARLGRTQATAASASTMAAAVTTAGKPEPKVEPAASQPVAPCTCGAVNDADARFCKACGARLAAV